MVTTNKTKLGTLIQLANEPNKKLLLSKKEDVVGVSIDKEFMPSVANLNGTDLSKYCILRKNRFAYNPMHVGRDERLPIALYKKDAPALVSPAYNVFEIKDGSPVVLDYLMLVFKTDLFDKLCWFPTDSSVRGGLSYDDFCDIEINLPSIAEQEKIVNQYNAIVNRIDVLERLNGKLFELGQIEYDKLLKCVKSETNIGFEVKSIGDYADVKSGYAFKSSWWQKSGKKVVKIGDILQNATINYFCDCVGEENAQKASDYKLTKGDLVIAMTGATCGKLGLISSNDEMYANQRVGKFYLGENPLNKVAFLYYSLLQEDAFRILHPDGDSGSAQDNISSDDIKNINIVFPPENLINKFNRNFSVVFNSILNNHNEIIKLNNLKTFVISKL